MNQQPSPPALAICSDGAQENGRHCPATSNFVKHSGGICQAERSKPSSVFKIPQNGLIEKPQHISLSIPDAKPAQQASMTCTKEAHLHQMPWSRCFSCLTRDCLCWKQCMSKAAKVSRHHYIQAVMLPVAILILSLGLSLWGVIASANMERDNRESSALTLGQDKVMLLQNQITAMLIPAVTMATIVSQEPSWPQLNATFQLVAPSLMALPTSALLSSIIMAPNGIIRGIYPLQGFDSAMDFDVLSSDFYRGEAMRAISSKQTTLTGPQLLKPGNGQFFGCVARIPVYISGVDANTTFGVPPDNPACNISQCYDAATRTKFWGFTMSLFSWQMMASRSPSSVYQVCQNGYNFMLAHVDNASNTEIPFAHCGDDGSYQGNSAPSIDNDALRISFEVPNNQWVLYIRDNRGWDPSWRAGAIAAVVLATVLLSALVWAFIVTRLMHMDLIQRHAAEEKQRLQDNLELVTNEFHQLNDAHGRLLRNQEILQTELQMATGNYKPVAIVDAGMPADRILSMMTLLLEGTLPTVSDIMAVQSALLDAHDIYRPIDFKKQMQQSALDSDVTQMLVAQLGGQSIDSPTIHGLGRHLHSAHSSICSSSSLLEAFEEPFSNLSMSLAMLIQPRLFMEGNGHAEGEDMLVSKNSGGSFSKSMHRAARRPSNRSNYQPDSMVMPRSRRSSIEIKSRRSSAANYSSSMALSYLDESSGLLKLSPSTHRLGMENSAFSKPSLPTEISSHSDAPTAEESISLSLLPGAPIIDELEHVLSTHMSWTFDVFKLHQASQGHPLSTLGFFLLHHTGLIKKFNIKGVVLARFLCTIECGYKNNAYHNRTHAADVLQTLHTVLHQGGFIPEYANPLTLMACYLAAIVHDYEHVGLTNDFLINSSDALALRYNDKAPMENHHLAAAFTVLKHPSFNFLAGLLKAEFSSLRSMVIELVLGTDMKQHFAIVSQFTTVHRISPGTSTPSDKVLSRNQSSDVTEHDPSKTCLMPIDSSERLLSLKMAIKCSDLGHTCAPLDEHVRWVTSLENELFKQGDTEKAFGLPISPLFDRDKQGITKSQVGFYDIVVIPLYHAFSKVFVGCKPLMAGAMENYHYWHDQEETQASTGKCLAPKASAPTHAPAAAAAAAAAPPAPPAPPPAPPAPPAPPPAASVRDSYRDAAATSTPCNSTSPVALQGSHFRKSFSFAATMEMVKQP